MGHVRADEFADVPLGSSQLQPPAWGNSGASRGAPAGAASTAAGSPPRFAPRSVSLAQHYATATATVTLAGAGKPVRLCLVGLACLKFLQVVH